MCMEGEPGDEAIHPPSATPLVLVSSGVAVVISLLRGRPPPEFPKLSLREAGLGGLDDDRTITCGCTFGPLYGLGGIGGEAEASLGEEDRISATASCVVTSGGVACEGEV